jgi:hypothetical protein
MSLITPTAVPSMGTRRVLALPTAANLNAIKLSEVTSAANISCYLTRSGGWAPTKDQASISHQPYCSSQDFEIPGAKSRQLMLQYTFNLNDEDSDVARLELQEGASLVLVHFLQKDEDDDEFAIGDWYEAVPVRMGEQNVVPMEDNALDRIQQKAFVRGDWTGLHQLVAS